MRPQTSRGDGLVIITLAQSIVLALIVLDRSSWWPLRFLLSQAAEHDVIRLWISILLGVLAYWMIDRAVDRTSHARSQRTRR